MIHCLIAKEKAGIIKKGVPVVLGATSEEVICVVAETAAQKGSKLILSSKNTSYESGLLGACQQENIDTVYSHRTIATSWVGFK